MNDRPDNNHKVEHDMAARKHADVIKAWADGAQIQCRPPQFGLENRRDWRDNNAPAFVDNWEYRVKPTEPEFPLSQMTEEELRRLLVQNRGLCESTTMARIVANAALCHAVSAGQVVRREEFDRMCAEHSKALSDVRQRLHDALFSSPARSWK